MCGFCLLRLDASRHAVTRHVMPLLGETGVPGQQLTAFTAPDAAVMEAMRSAALQEQLS